jgi:hypothetical protein
MDYAADIADVKPGSNSLAALTDLAQQQMQAEAEVARLESELKAANARLREISEQTLPDAMYEIGMSEFTLADGTTIKIKSDLTLSVPKNKKAEVANWLETVGEGGLVKQLAVIDLGKGKSAESAAEQIRSFANDLGIGCEVGVDVNTTSLKAVLRRRMSAGEAVPDLGSIGGYDYRKSVISKKG